jgi:hypothetical protein
MRDVTTVAEVDEMTEEITEFAADMWDTDPETGRVEWESWISRFEARHDVSLPALWDDPAMRRLKKIAKAAIRESIGG